MNQFKMSLFLPLISPVKDSTTGRIIQPPTLTPYKEITLQEVYKLITSSERLKTLTETVRRATENGDEKVYRMLKQQTLPYVTPCGVFSYRKSDSLTGPSGLIVVDIDHLDSRREAEKLKRQLFDDLLLRPVLAFTSPSGHGVKAFIPYDLARIPDTKQNTSENIHWAMNYVQAIYDFHSSHPDREDKKTNHSGKGVDRTGKDLVRACFLSYDEEALIRREI
ncbi:BT4734/BF3469 family protein [Phocaeicola dorei]|uniref:BT4734/BF3469 family protein n=1 Tax=Phocaeicola dorei TaxID=357276 RepID=UPI001F2B0623|nr:BT4734/BF3469 family protein [Phocaeicola dorei]MCE8759658.1 virulence protein E [Phocaeicola dorei]